jgi:hypothetical protein
MIQPPHLNVEITNNQRKALNPTTRDVQIGAVIGQIFGDKAKTNIARHRIGFMTGSVNSYAQILNGLSQSECISTYNNLAASLSAYHSEVQAQNAIAVAEKQISVVEKAAKKVLRDTQVTQQCLLLLPICTHHVSGGLTHCLTLNLNSMRGIY